MSKFSPGDKVKHMLLEGWSSAVPRPVESTVVEELPSDPALYRCRTDHGITVVYKESDLQHA